MSKPTSHPRARWWRESTYTWVALLTLAAGFLAGLGPAADVQATDDVGYRDFSYSGTSAPTAEKPQSKLWFAHGSWWGSLFSVADDAFNIYKLDWETQTWIDTGTRIDNRDKSSADCLWDGTKLYVVSAVFSGSSDLSIRVLRFSYDAGTGKFSRDSGFPVTVATASVETVVLDKDTTGKIWLTYTLGNGDGTRSVYVTHSTTDDRTFTTPFVLPVTGATNLTADDISTLVAYGGKIGVMWGNQNDDTMYFASHRDGDPDDLWSLNPALQGPEYPDDHLNMKALQTDAGWRIYAAVKTSLDSPSDPGILLLILDEQGNWSHRTFGTQEDDHTRPIVLLDPEHQQVYVFASAPCCNGGTVYYKQSDLNNPEFPDGLGKPFIRSSTDTNINNPASTKQPLSSTSGLVVIAGDDRTDYYLHNALALGTQDTTAPDTTIDSGPSGTVGSSSASFSFSSTEAGSSFECRLDGASFTSCTSPTDYSDLEDGSHTFEVRAIDSAGNVDATPASRTWTVDTMPPDTTIDSGPSGTVTTDSAEFSFSSTEASSTFECRLDGAAFEACTSPKTYTNLPNGSHTFEVRAIDGAGNVDSTPASRTWTVDVSSDTTAPDTTITSGPSGTVTNLSATFTFTSNVTDATFECRVDGAAFEACTSPATYERLADGSHTFEVRSIDSAGNVDPTPASRTWSITPLFSDGFESGDFSAWTDVQTGGDGQAVVQSSIVKDGNYAAQLSETGNSGSFAYARKSFASAQTELTVSGDFQITQEGDSGGNVPFLRLFDSSGLRLVSFYRQNQDRNQLYVWHGDGYNSTSGELALNNWGHIELHVITNGPSASTVEIWLNGTLIYQTTTASLGSDGVLTVQIGNDTKRQTFTIIVDNVSVHN